MLYLLIRTIVGIPRYARNDTYPHVITCPPATTLRQAQDMAQDKLRGEAISSTKRLLRRTGVLLAMIQPHICHSEEPFGCAQDLRLRDEESRCREKEVFDFGKRDPSLHSVPLRMTSIIGLGHTGREDHPASSTVRPDNMPSGCVHRRGRVTPPLRQ